MNNFPQSCASCGKLECSKSYASRNIIDKGGINTFILDEVWPEFNQYLRNQSCDKDKIIIPGIFGNGAIRRYEWCLGSHHATFAVLKRHLALHLVRNKSGGIRQRAYLKHNNQIAAALAKSLDYRTSHLIISQNFIPFFASAGLLDGRTFDVLMSQYPIFHIHKLLDALKDDLPNSKTIGDFRANDELLEIEQTALSKANKIITPHHGIAKLYGENAYLLDWVLPKPIIRAGGNRIAFIGPTIARQGVYWLRDIARKLREPLVVYGNSLEGGDFWDGIDIEHRTMNPNWLDDIGAILHPAAFTNQPRKLLEAAVNGVKIYANDGCGLNNKMYEPLSAFNLY